MANQGKRMVKENLIAQIGQGGGAEYTAGTGINIAEDVISVDSDVAMKTDLPDEVSGTNDGSNWTSLTIGNDTYGLASGGGNTLYSYMQTIDEVILELREEDPEATYQDAITEWLKRMPTFVSYNINAAGMETLRGMGFKNLIQIQLGAQYDIQGYFSIIFEGSTNTTPYAMQVCMSDRVGNATKALWNIASDRIQHTVVIGKSEIEFQNCRYRETNTTLADFNDLFNNPIDYVQQFGVNAQTEATLGMGYAYVVYQGRQAETVGISVQGGIPANNQFNVQLKAPTTDGTYALGVDVNTGSAPYFHWSDNSGTPILQNLPDTPSTTWTLKCIVDSDGQPGLTWVQDQA